MGSAEFTENAGQRPGSGAAIDLDRRESVRRLAVLGGGLSGLSAAYRLTELTRSAEQPIAVTLFEAGSQLGGTIATQRVGEYLVESGADSFITNKPEAVNLCQRLGIEDRLIPTDSRFRRSLVLRNGRPVPVPEGFNLLGPAKAWPILTSPIFSLWGKLRLGCEYFVSRRLNRDDESLASFVRRRFGQEALDRLVQPLVGGIYTSDPEKLSLQATLPRFIEMERKYGSVIRGLRRQSSAIAAEGQASGARYGLFASFKDGIAELFIALARTIESATTIRLNTKVCKLSRAEANDGWRIEVADGTSEVFDAVIVALPAFAAAGLIGSIDPALSIDLELIEYASSVVVVSGHRLQDISHPLNAFGLVIPAIENRKILAVSFASRKFPGRAPEGHAQLRTFVGGALQPQLADLPDDELSELVRAELAELLGVRGQPDFMIVCRHRRAMPQYHVGHVELVERIEQQALRHSGLALAGNAYHGVGIPDCIRSGEQAAEQAMNALRTPP